MRLIRATWTCSQRRWQDDKGGSAPRSWSGPCPGLAFGKEQVMAYALRSPCSYSGCPALAVERGRCARHRRPPEQQYNYDRGPSTEQGYGWRWQQMRRGWLRDNPDCVVCGSTANTVDHIIPRSRGGPDDESNLQSMCRHCHNVKRQRERVTGTGPGGQPYETAAMKTPERR